MGLSGSGADPLVTEYASGHPRCSCSKLQRLLQVRGPIKQPIKLNAFKRRETCYDMLTEQQKKALAQDIHTFGHRARVTMMRVLVKVSRVPRRLELQSTSH